jgi:hypothetical protein
MGIPALDMYTIDKLYRIYCVHVPCLYAEKIAFLMLGGTRDDPVDDYDVM